MTERPAGGRTGWVALAALLVLAAALRFATIGDQSYWRDEASTVLDLDGSFGHLLDRLADLEGMPPLYFSLAWVWAKVFGDGEAALRSLSALAGLATVPVAWAIARRLAGGSLAAAVAAGALAATSPFLVWFSQEARPYALLVLLAAVATLFFVQALESPGRREILGWGAAAAAALATHYFAVFLIVPQASVLLWRDRRAVVPGLTLIALAGLALLPLVLAQRDGRVDWVGEIPLGTRVLDIPKHWIAGPFGTPVDALAAAGILLVGAGALAGLLRARRPAAPLVALTAAGAVALPLAAAVAGLDYVLDRYVIAALVAVLALAAAGFARSGRAGVAAAAVTAALFAGFTVAIAADEELQREDWRGVAAQAEALLPGAVAVVATPPADAPLAVYLPAAVAPSGPVAVRSVLTVAPWRFGRPRPAPPAPPPGFEPAERMELPTATLVVFHSAADGPVMLDPATLSSLVLEPGEQPVLRVAGGG